MFKLYKAEFNTAHITIDDVRKTYNFGMPDEEVLELQAAAQRGVHGVKMRVSEWDYSQGNFSLMSHDEKDDPKIKELIWSIEQGGGFYCNDRERFDKDWANDKYDPGGALHFPKELFANIEFVEEYREYSIYAVGIDRMEYIAAKNPKEALEDHLTRSEYSVEEQKDISVSKVPFHAVWDIEQENGGTKEMTISEHLKDFTYSGPAVIRFDE